MRYFISILTVLALVISTTFAPAVSHAMPHDNAEPAPIEASKDHDCHGHGKTETASEKTANNDKDASGKCCDKGMCKCVGGNCHSLSKFFGNGGNSLSSFSSSSVVFAFDSQSVDSALPNRLKRPPRT